MTGPYSTLSAGGVCAAAPPLETVRTPAFLTVKEFCAMFHVGKSTLYREAACGRLRLHKLGRATRVAMADASAWAATAIRDRRTIGGAP